MQRNPCGWNKWMRVMKISLLNISSSLLVLINFVQWCEFHWKAIQAIYQSTTETFLKRSNSDKYLTTKQMRNKGKIPFKRRTSPHLKKFLFWVQRLWKYYFKKMCSRGLKSVITLQLNELAIYIFYQI